jgi:plastocyanin
MVRRVVTFAGEMLMLSSRQWVGAGATRALGAGLVLVLSACGGSDSGGTTPAPVAATVAVTAATTGTLVSVGDTRQLTAAVAAANGTAIAAPSVTWTTSDANVATVAGTGISATVTATGNGSATITATSGAVNGTVQVQVAQRLAAVTATTTATSLSIGATAPLTVTARDARGVAIAGVTGATFATGDRTRALVSDAGVVTAIAPGATTITTSLTRDGVTVTANSPVTVNAPVSAAATAAVQATDANVFTPPTITVAEGGTVTWSFGGIGHNVVFQSAGSPTNVAVTSSATAARVFATAGSYPYACTLHAGMTGTVNVVANALFTQMNGANERPNAVPTTANGAAVFTRSGSTINYVVSYQGIASSPTGMHIHAPAGPNTNSGIIVDLMRTPMVGTNGVLTGSFTATDIRSIAGQPPITLDSLTSLLRNGQGYVNVHSSQYLAGEIRGQLANPPI